jgi:hypothetical protein
MSAHCSAALADSTTASAGLGFDTRSSVSRILGGEGCLGSGGLESPSTTTYELWVAQKGFEGKFQTDRYTTPSLVTGGTKQGEVPLLFSAAASPAKTSQLPDAELDSKPEKLVPLLRVRTGRRRACSSRRVRPHRERSRTTFQPERTRFRPPTRDAGRARVSRPRLASAGQPTLRSAPTTPPRLHPRSPMCWRTTLLPGTS